MGGQGEGIGGRIRVLDTVRLSEALKIKHRAGCRGTVGPTWIKTSARHFCQGLSVRTSTQHVEWNNNVSPMIIQYND